MGVASINVNQSALGNIPFTTVSGVAMSNLIKNDIVIQKQGAEWTEAISDITVDTSPFNQTVRTIAYSPDGKYLAACAGNNITIYSISGTTLTLVNPFDIAPTELFGCCFSADSRLFVSCGGNGTLNIYSIENDIFIKQPNPDVQPGSTCLRVAISPNKQYCAVGMTSSPYLVTYKIGANNSFTKLTNPASVPTASVNDLDFTPDSTQLVLAINATTSYSRYQTDPTRFINKAIGTSIASQLGYAVVVNPLRDRYYLGNKTSPTLASYTVTDVTNDSFQSIGANVRGLDISFDGRFMFTGESATPYFRVLRFNTTNSQWQTQTLPATYTAPTSAVQDLSASRDGQFVAVALASAPYLRIYRTPIDNKIIKSSFSEAATLSQTDVTYKGLGFAASDATTNNAVVMNKVF